MDLWIRSQDRTTLITSYEIYIAEQCNMYVIRAKKTSHVLGVYSTFERALEVLDEIENHLINSSFAKKTNGLGEVKEIIPNPLFVYEMPEE